MPIQQTDNTRVAKTPVPTGSYIHYDSKAPKPGATQDTGTITEDTSNSIRKAIQNYTASYLNSNFANSPFMDVMRWLPGLSYMEKVVTAQPVGENESLSMVSPIKVNPKYYDQNGKISLQLVLPDINKGRKEAIDFLSSDVKAASDAHNKAIATRVGLRYFQPYTKGSPSRASYPMSRSSAITQYDPDAIWIGPDSNGYWVTPNIIDGNAAGKVFVVNGEPGKDLMTISLKGDPRNSAFHETLHRGSYGTAPAINMDTAEKAIAAHHNNMLYNWKTQKILNDNYGVRYLSDPAEAAVNALEIGKIMGLTPGQSYPGKTRALQMFSDAINSGHYKLNFLKGYKWETKPKRVWDALTGKYYILPAIGVVGAATLNTNDDTPRKSE